MSHITDNPGAGGWRTKWVQAQFRDAIFYVETNARASGRRVALHEYPKRSIPYAEDMGRKAINITVQGYCIGRLTLRRDRATREGGGFASGSGIATESGGRSTFPGRDYLTMKNELIVALEADGPGQLRLPMQHKFMDINVMVQGYSVNESRERGGMCAFEMTFVEFGDPHYRSNISTPAEIVKAAASVDQVVAGLQQGTASKEAVQQLINAVRPYIEVQNRTGGYETGGSF